VDDGGVEFCGGLGEGQAGKDAKQQKMGNAHIASSYFYGGEVTAKKSSGLSVPAIKRYKIARKRFKSRFCT